MPANAELLPGNLDLVILKAVSMGDVHGYGVLLRIQAISNGAILVQQGALYPALYRLEHRGLIASTWGTSDNNRRAKFYSLTALGEREFSEQQTHWSRLTEAISLALAAVPQPLPAAG
ncbi:MAG: PadR family transcriptional regulator [Phycisphaerae bacterium]|nr:PadR family transcriptional regulator [Gemmatimonadaceae bacterium]